MSRRYPLAVTAATALALPAFAEGLDRNPLTVLMQAVQHDQAQLVLVAQPMQWAQDAITYLSLLRLYRACRAIETIAWLRQALTPLLDDAGLAVFDEHVWAQLSACLDRQALVNQEVVTWFYQKGELA
jgi:hypothetical protein